MAESVEIQTAENGERYIEVEVTCKDCGGTGVYSGFGEPKGVANVCWSCKGKGGRLQKFRLFNGVRKVNKDVKFVRDGYKETHRIPYEKFLNGEMP